MKLALLEIARIVHTLNRAYCYSIGDESQLPWEDAPAWQVESAVTGVEAIQSGRIVTPEQSHESWLEEKARTGWRYGKVKNSDLCIHPCIVPYAELPPEQKVKDAIFFGTAKALLTLN